VLFAVLLLILLSVGKKEPFRSPRLLRGLGIVQVVAGVSALAFGLLGFIPDFLIIVGLRNAQSHGFGFLIGGFLAFCCALFCLRGWATLRTAAEKEWIEQEAPAVPEEEPECTVSSGSLGKKIAVVVSLLLVVGGMAAICVMNATKLKYKLEAPSGRVLIDKTDEYYGAADHVVAFTPPVSGTYRLSVRPTSSVKEADICPSVRLYGNDRRILPAFCSRIGLWAD
jgi:hypothetical protein